MTKTDKITFEELWNRLPEVIRVAMSKCEQDPIWHPEGPADIHTKLVFEYANNNYDDVDLLVAAIFHDLGKPETRSIRMKDNVERISNFNHEMESLKYIDKYFNLFSDFGVNKNDVYEVVKNHMRAHLYISGQLKDPKKRKEFELLKNFNNLIKFSNFDDERAHL